MSRTRIMVAGALASLALLGGVAGCTGHPRVTPTAGPTPTPAAQNDPAALLNQGIQQGNARDFDAATATFNRVIALDKNNKYAWFNLGVIAQTESHTDQAIKDYDAALAADPNFTSAMYNKAILLESSDVNAAIGLYQNIVKINASASSAYLRLGLLQDKQGDHAGALASFRTAVTLDPTLKDTVPASYQSKVTGG
jgi:tetratricopeptide (TPR) repeat protein